MDKRIENTNLNVVRRLIHEDQRLRAREALEEKLLAGLVGEDVEMGPEDWAEIRHEVTESVRRRARGKNK